MNFLEIAKKRYSCRKYASTPVEEEKIQRCMEAARLAPSACNAQPWHYIVITNPEMRDKVARETVMPMSSMNKFTQKAPALVLVVSKRPNIASQIGGFLKKKDFYLMDMAISAQHFCLQATSEGLGSCIVGWFNEKKIRKMVNVPVDARIGLIIACGYPEKKLEKVKHARKTLEEISSLEKY